MLWRRQHRGFNALHRRYTSPDQPRGLEDARPLLQFGTDLLDLMSWQRPAGKVKRRRNMIAGPRDLHGLRRRRLAAMRAELQKLGVEYQGGSR